MERLFENQELISSKKNLLTQIKAFKRPEAKRPPSVYLFHGIQLAFYFENLSFAEKVLAHLPKSWARAEINQSLEVLNIYLFDNWDKSWDYEVNPDCLIENEPEFESAIQRDFVGIDYKVFALLSLTDLHADGIFNALRWLLPRRMLLKDTFLLHSSCVVHEGKAYFFLGHSGAGKSTIASLSGDRIILGDDMNVMRFDGKKAYARSGGLGGLSFTNTDFDNEFEVEGFFWLEQSKESKKTKMSPSQGATKLLASLANIFWESMPEKKREELLDLALNVSVETEFYHLEFTKDERFWKNVIEK